MRRSVKTVLGIGIGLVSLCLVAIVVFYVFNQSLPTHSKDPAVLSDSEQALLYEANHLRKELGAQVWPGWDQAKYIPFVAYNEAYAFLLGMADPARGWSVPGKVEVRGAIWEQAAGTDQNPAGYYCQPVQDASRVIGAFTVRIGETWAASLPTYEWYQVELVNGMRRQFPPVIRDIFPYALARNTLIGSSDQYVTNLLHEAFHAYQMTMAPNRLLLAEAAMKLESSYPWDDEKSEQAWKAEIDALVNAVKSGTLEDTKSNALQFLKLRHLRRSSTSLAANLADFERQREWLEGTAKYVELSIGHTAAQLPDYKPLEGVGFENYSGFERFYNLQIDQVSNMVNQKDETRFYYTGMAQAVLLDRLLPDWKERELTSAYLEDLLTDAIR